MSLINQMLQDLDARAGKPGAGPLPGDVRPVLAPEGRGPWLRVALGAGAVVLVAAGVVGWKLIEVVPPPVVVPAPAPVPAAVVVAMPAAAPVQVVDVAPPEPVSAPVPDLPPLGSVPVTVPVAAKPALKKPVIAKPAPPVARVAPPTRGAEDSYRRALVVLEDGRVTEAIATLQAGLRLDPRHEPSRHTLVGLLIEAKRPDEAMRQLQAALALDPRQPAMAMLLARLQVERGGPAIETLMRTLPYAAGNGDYHAFLAGVLQREGRAREAIEHYQAALRTAPGNGVWWMGLAISLQGEGRNADAVAAFEQAQASGTLSADLQGFVERRLRQLGR